MDFKDGAHRLAVVGSFVVGALAMWFSNAHATCTVEEKLLRDGIVSLALPTGSTPTPLALVSLGTIDDPTWNTTYSVWRVSNAGITSYRAQLEDPAGQRIPFLVRAGSEITLRSDSLADTGDHALIVDNATVDQAAIAATTFADSRVLDDVDCFFDGNPLYAGEHAGTLKISTVHGAVVAEIPGTLDLSAIAMGQSEGDLWMGELWTLRGNSLRAFDIAGAEIANFTLPATAPAGISGRQRLAVNARGGDIWVAIGSTLYWLTMDGLYADSVTYGEEIREIALGTEGRLWVVLESDVHVVSSDRYLEDAIQEVAHIVLPAAVSAITYDSYWSQTWIVAGNALSKYEGGGVLIESLPLTVTQPIRQIEPDGAGAMWVSSDDRLFHVQADGSVATEIAAFASGAMIVDLATDPADGTAWVTSGARIRHYDRNGALVHDLLPTTPGGGARQIRFLQLFADRAPPTLQIVSPVDGEIVPTARPTLRIRYYDGGRGVAGETLELSLEEDEPLPADCAISAFDAVCVPTIDLPDGEVTFSARVYDLAGNLSPPEQRSFTVYSNMPAEIQVNHPYDGMFTNYSRVSVEGWVRAATGLTVNGAQVAIDSPPNRFWHDIDLVEGPNLLRLIAVNANGVSTQLDITVVLDTIAPAAPNLSSIVVTVDVETGHLRLTAPAGAFEPFARVFIYNADLGYGTQLEANEDGSLSAIVSAEPGHQLFVTVSDQAGNEHPTLEMPYVIGQMSLTITSPSGPVTVATHDLVIRGTFSGPVGTSVTANGVVAAMSGGAGGREFAVRVRLAPGQNAIQVIAAAPGQPSVTREITATLSGAEPFRIEASETFGPAPLEVEFTVHRFDATRIRRVEVDFEGDDDIDTVSESSRVGAFVHQYLVPGSYTAVFRIRTAADALFTYQVPVIVDTVEDQNAGVRGVWQRFRGALTAGDTSLALDCMLPSVAQRYSSVFTTLQASLPQIAASFSEIHPTGAPGLAEYVMTRDVNGQPTAFLIYFARGSDGVWRIASM